MAAPSYTYTLANSTTADADEVMQNFNDILNGVSDGSKDLSISALTVAGAATFNGAVTLGNATGDDLTPTGRWAADMDPKTASTYALGSSSLPWQSINIDNGATDGGAIYFGASTTDFLKSDAATGGDLTMGGFTGLDLGADCSIKTFGRFVDTKSQTVDGDYTITDTDGISILLCTAGSSANHTITLPTAADNTGRVITIKKVDNGNKHVIVEGEGSETIDGALNNIVGQYSNATYTGQYAYLTVVAESSSWHVIDVGGEILSADSTSAWSSGAWAEMISMSIPPGRWTLTGACYLGSGTAARYLQISIVTSSAAAGDVGDGTGLVGDFYWTTNGLGTIHLANVPATLTSATTYYLNGFTSSTSGGTTGEHGFRAVRVG